MADLESATVAEAHVGPLVRKGSGEAGGRLTDRARQLVGGTPTIDAHNVVNDVGDPAEFILPDDFHTRAIWATDALLIHVRTHQADRLWVPRHRGDFQGELHACEALALVEGAPVPRRARDQVVVAAHAMAIEAQPNGLATQQFLMLDLLPALLAILRGHLVAAAAMLALGAATRHRAIIRYPLMLEVDPGITATRLDSLVACLKAKHFVQQLVVVHARAQARNGHGEHTQWRHATLDPSAREVRVQAVAGRARKRRDLLVAALLALRAPGAGDGIALVTPPAHLVSIAVGHPRGVRAALGDPVARPSDAVNDWTQVVGQAAVARLEAVGLQCRASPAHHSIPSQGRLRAQHKQRQHRPSPRTPRLLQRCAAGGCAKSSSRSSISSHGVRPGARNA
mmetsp:Transcript_48468/g.156564  ORF Transcript_48468/g.156564 Transcript_48468/m.156564 type:complete len:396 (+) Transcript_48468:1700-2887(+)